MKIDIEDYADIRWLHGEGYTVKDVAHFYAATETEIAAIVEGRSTPVRPLGPLPVVATYVEKAPA